jgi:hypothetical protein
MRMFEAMAFEGGWDLDRDSWKDWEGIKDGLVVMCWKNASQPACLASWQGYSI